MNTSITEKGKRYKHIDAEERMNIAFYHKKYSIRAIAKELCRSPSTISREIRRNGSVRTYDNDKAHNKANRRKRLAHKKERIACTFTRDYIETHIKKFWSPEQIANRLHKDHPQYRTNYESIYQYIYNECPKLYEFLRRKHRKKKKRGLKYSPRAPKIPHRVPISQRGDISNEYGHWEADLVGSSSKATVLALVEKQTRFCKFLKIPNKTAHTMKYALLFSLRDIPSSMLRSITFDNGSENTCHHEINKRLDIKSYFCTPYHSWEKGLVENTIGLFRQFYPKGTRFNSVKGCDIIEAQELINNRPRKSLAFATPNEAMSVALRH